MTSSAKEGPTASRSAQTRASSRSRSGHVHRVEGAAQLVAHLPREVVVPVGHGHLAVEAHGAAEQAGIGDLGRQKAGGRHGKGGQECEGLHGFGR